MNQFGAAMREYGWIEGQNFTLEPRYTAGKTEHDRVALATELIEQKVGLIVAINSASAQAAKRVPPRCPLSVPFLFPHLGGRHRGQRIRDLEGLDDRV